MAVPTLAGGVLDPWSNEEHRRLMEISVRPSESRASGPSVEIPPMGADEPVRLHLSRREFDAARARAPERTGEIGPIDEEADAFVVHVVLSEEADRALIATYTVPKRTWDDWWAETEAALPVMAVKAVASPVAKLPAPAPAALALGRTSAGSSRAASDERTSSGGTSCSPTNSWDNGVLGAVPEGRSDATAVWTGRVMVVWGGSREGRPLQTGGRYDPVTDSWTPTSTVNAPEARWSHTAVWTGSEVIVWGGFGSSMSDVATGGRYAADRSRGRPRSAAVRWRKSRSWRAPTWATAAGHRARPPAGPWRRRSACHAARRPCVISVGWQTAR